MKCKTCGQSRPKVPIFIRNIAGFSDFEVRKCKECGRLPADNPAVKQGMKWKMEPEKA